MTKNETAEAEEANKVGPLHEQHAAYIKRTTGLDVDPEAVFAVYSTRTAFRGSKARDLEPSKEYSKFLKARDAAKKQAEKDKAAAKKEREAAKEKKAAEKAEKAAAKKQADAEAASNDDDGDAKPAAKKSTTKGKGGKAKGGSKGKGGKAKSSAPF